MVKILSQSGRSLADIYNVRGSIAGIDQLETRELPIVHEMGATVFSERFRTSVREVSSGAIAQNTDWDVILATLPATVTRILGVIVATTAVASLVRASLMLRDPISGGGTEIPFWVWDGANSIATRFMDSGTIVVQDLLLASPTLFQIPTFSGGVEQGAVPVRDLAFRGRAGGFGAGTVTTNAFIFVAFSFTPSVPSFGLPIPSW